MKEYIKSHMGEIDSAYARAANSNRKQGKTNSFTDQTYDYLVGIVEKNLIPKAKLPQKALTAQNDRHITQYANVSTSGDNMTIQFKDGTSTKDQIAVFEYIKGNSALKTNLESNKIKFENVIIDDAIIDKYRKESDYKGTHDMHHILSIASPIDIVLIFSKLSSFTYERFL